MAARVIVGTQGGKVLIHSGFKYQKNTKDRIYLLALLEKRMQDKFKNKYFRLK
jgi:hypothetical protein